MGLFKSREEKDAERARISELFPLKAGGYPSAEKPADPRYAASKQADQEWKSRGFGVVRTTSKDLG
ncbi:MAG: hypothetical protein GC137_09430 [Alphaproteobacteria bacterium]|nr:hypothetical protein [Alphaproteobacteria bacterium]